MIRRSMSSSSSSSSRLSLASMSKRSKGSGRTSLLIWMYNAIGVTSLLVLALFYNLFTEPTTTPNEISWSDVEHEAREAAAAGFAVNSAGSSSSSSSAAGQLKGSTTSLGKIQVPSRAIPTPEDSANSASSVAVGGVNNFAAYNKKNQKSTPSCAVLLHIPKTGGFSVRETFVKQVVREMQWDMFEYYAEGDDPLWPLNQLKRSFGTLHVQNWEDPFQSNHFSVGHLTPHFFRETNTHHCFKMTILREPIDRVASSFYYHQHLDYEWYECLTGDGCEHYEEYQNDMVRQLAGLSMTWNKYNSWEYNQIDADDETLLEAAKQNLAKMDAVCFLNSIDLCLDEIAEKVFHTTYDPPEEIANENHYRPTFIPAEVVDMVKKANNLDIALFAWAQETFNKK